MPPPSRRPRPLVGAVRLGLVEDAFQHELVELRRPCRHLACAAAEGVGPSNGGCLGQLHFSCAM
eukprot:15478122-Alexandrium_andersonii.AAC.1